MEKENFNLEEFIDSFYDYAISRAVELGIVKASEEYHIPELKDKPETYWTPIGSFIHKQFQNKYPNQIHLEPIVSGQITAYTGMAVAFLWYNKNEAVTSNLLDGNGEYEMNDEGKALYKFLDVKFASSFSIDVDEMLRGAEDIDDVQKYFLKYIGYNYETKEEINLRGAFNNIFSDFYLKIYEETKKRNIYNPITITARTMNLMFKLGLTIGMQRYLRKYHIVGWIDGEDKNPPRFLVAANPIPYSTIIKGVEDVDFGINCKTTVCFLLPYSLDWFNVIDKHQCDKEEGIVKEWIPNMNEYEPSPVTISGEKYVGYMHNELVKYRSK